MNVAKNESWIDRFNLFMYDEIDSTSDEAKRLLLSGGIVGEYIVVATSQYRGRGRNKRFWVSNPGNLFMSAVLEPKAPAEILPQISYVSGLAIARALSRFIEPSKIKLKWPNDVMVEGKKIAGILLESLIGYEALQKPRVILGVGINLAVTPSSEEINVPVTSVSEYYKRKIRANDMLSYFMQDFLYYYNIWQREGFAKIIRSEWIAQAFMMSEPLTISTINDRITGLFKGLDDHGCLRLEVDEGHEVLISSGEIIYGNNH